jgi:hypothetical protein
MKGAAKRGGTALLEGRIARLQKNLNFLLGSRSISGKSLGCTSTKRHVRSPGQIKSSRTLPIRGNDAVWLTWSIREFAFLPVLR